ncbi:MAG TPA: DUF3014 domain-containing protein, partial [Usitatibacter sp.]|nr:DUF3014 domain-containing protein [Usitatibacter sp.]
FWWWQRSTPPPPPPPPEAKVEAPPAAPTGPKFPVTPDTSAPLPALNASDPAMNEALSGLIGPQAVERFLNLDGIVRNIVATVDNLPRETVASRLNPVKPVGGAMVTKGKEATLTIAPENAARYLPLVRLAQSLDAKRVTALYFRFYPLFQQAYEDLGYPGRYFNDRLVEAIDDLLAAPEIDKPIALVVPHVLYEYADPELESLSAGRKIMIRVGRGNEAILKAKLRELRQEIAAGAPPR